MHHAHHLLVVSKVDRRLGGEAEGVAPFFLPGLDLGKQQFGVALVADEVVVHQEDGAPPPQLVEPSQLGHQLFGGFGAGLASVENDDVAKLAVERAAP